MSATPHILVVNGVKVRRPVFILGAPQSGTALLAHALKQLPGFHLTMGRPGVLRVGYAFARKPSLAKERRDAAVRVLRDAFADSWRIAPDSCRDCSPQCRAAAGKVAGVEGICVHPNEVHRYGDASQDLIYTGDLLLEAFPDAQLLQLVRDGRDVVASMLGDELSLAWFKPGVANVDDEFPNPFLGVERETDRAAWSELSLAGKCALRWRSCVRLNARLRTDVSREQLLTVRYEDLATRPRGVARDVAGFLDLPLEGAGRLGIAHGSVGTWRRQLSSDQVEEVERLAGEELQRLGYLRPRRSA